MIDVTVVGSGPNGLAAAVTAARAGLGVRVIEAAPTLGGGLRTAELTLPGYRHDVCSAVHPAALASPFFRAFGLAERIEWIIPDVSYAHPMRGGEAGIAYRDLDRTADALGRDGARWRRLLGPLLRRADGVVDFTGSQLLRIPRDPAAAVLFGLRAIEQGSGLWDLRFRGETARAMLTGVAAHAAGRQPSLATAGAGLLLAVHAHAGGWGFPVGGSQAIADALVADLVAHGGSVETGRRVDSLAQLEPSRVTLLDTSTALLMTANLPAGYRRALGRYRYGSGVAKVDFALSGPVPWSNPEVRRAPTVHLGGTREEIAAAEHAVARGTVPQHPYVLVTQPSVLDPTRAPAGHHVLWAYTHVPAASTLDATELVTAAVERSAPDFRDIVLASASRSAEELSRYDENYVGGDIYSGALSLRQLVKRPVVSTRPWRTPIDGVYLCSSATPPGPAVHGMNGWFAARLALRERFGIEIPTP
ncbi:NAD(P)/FAD-dependent oxidoreductase [Leifsonia bigeumensis]|uniref:Pyridine nucleotide-disulfide oxidoreductase domain-containing protein 2 n=1 Tax=Leifsonella bigeumensis TaxID=433643 RepID=A0ABP7F678_9MICO